MSKCFTRKIIVKFLIWQKIFLQTPWKNFKRIHQKNKCGRCDRNDRNGNEGFLVPYVRADIPINAHLIHK